MTDPLEKLANEWKNIRRPFAIYVTGQTALNAATIAYTNGGEVATTCSDVAKNLPLIAITNLVYAKTVDYIVKKLGRHGRVGANIFALAVAGGFYAYGLLTNDTDPTIPAAVGGTLGVILTNHQVSQIQKEERSNLLPDQHQTHQHQDYND